MRQVKIGKLSGKWIRKHKQLLNFKGEIPSIDTESDRVWTKSNTSKKKQIITEASKIKIYCLRI